MKEFEKFIKRVFPSNITTKERRDCALTWRAALKRVLDECHYYQSQDVIDFILEELEED